MTLCQLHIVFTYDLDALACGLSAVKKIAPLQAKWPCPLNYEIPGHVSDMFVCPDSCHRVSRHAEL